ncbi:GNAT family N-acetyltransferase [Candidatus Pacearchaeota archaeon]|nr:GNAT family N-acetyltransferase [Candidatus Pacearchaeota archaeon]
MQIIELDHLEYDSRLFQKLKDLAFSDKQSDFNRVFNGEFNFIYAFILKGKKALIGWSCIFETPETNGKCKAGVYVGVYVKFYKRHKGYGRLLLSKSFEYCKKNGLSYGWFDSKLKIWNKK